MTAESLDRFSKGWLKSLLFTRWAEQIALLQPSRFSGFAVVLYMIAKAGASCLFNLGGVAALILPNFFNVRAYFVG